MQELTTYIVRTPMGKPSSGKSTRAVCRVLTRFVPDFHGFLYRTLYFIVAFSVPQAVLNGSSILRRSSIFPSALFPSAFQGSSPLRRGRHSPVSFPFAQNRGSSIFPWFAKNFRHTNVRQVTMVFELLSYNLGKKKVAKQ